mmetsp:Transcript_38287/g.83291  ORF Transcript_38287/g.83291 Transcript_38287/m.83291 type:complete len:217 (-) Transcript_38287:18-668(-)
MRLHLRRQPPVAVDVAEVELSAGRQHAVRLVDDALLVGAQVHHAVAHNDVELPVLQPRLVQKLDVALDEGHVWLGVPESFRVAVHVGAGHVQLLISHVDADHGARLANKGRHHVAVTAASRAKIKNTKPFDAARQRGATSVKLLVHLPGNPLDGLKHMVRWFVARCAGARLQILRSRQHLAIVVLDHLEGLRLRHSCGCHGCGIRMDSRQRPRHEQ